MIILRTIDEAIPEQWAELDGFRLDTATVEGYLMQLILWIRILITTIRLFCLVAIVV